jgi:hypothetical protein
MITIVFQWERNDTERHKERKAALVAFCVKCMFNNDSPWIVDQSKFVCQQISLFYDLLII